MAVNNAPVIGAISLRKQGIRLRFCWFYSLFFMFLYFLYLAVMQRFPCRDIIKICSSYSHLRSLFSRLASACVMISVKLCFVLRHFTRCFAVFYTMKCRKSFYPSLATISPPLINPKITPSISTTNYSPPSSGRGLGERLCMPFTISPLIINNVTPTIVSSRNCIGIALLSQWMNFAI